MGDEADVGLVDAHAERDGRDHDEAVLAQEPRLVGRADPVVQPRVVGQRRDALCHEEIGGLLHRVAGEAVDDARLARVLGAQEIEQLLAGLVLGGDAVLDVGPVEAGDEVLGVLEIEPGGDLGAGRRRRRA